MDDNENNETTGNEPTHALFYQVEMTSLRHSNQLVDWFCGVPLAALRDRPEVTSIDLFRPHPQWNEVVRFDDGPPPALLVEIGVSERDEIERLSASTSFRAALELHVDPGMAVSFGAYSIHRFPIEGEIRVAPRSATTSFVVQYFGPTPDVPAFGAAYVAKHPRLLGRFPGIRNVICYPPVDWRHRGLPADGAIFRNEVVFDDLAALNRALQSDIMTELAADTAGFPPFRINTHHAMQRARLA